MSVSQVKSLFKEMADYLDKDKGGQEKLKKLKDVVNVLRTDLAAAKELAEQAEKLKIAARERADAVEAKVAELVPLLQTRDQQVANLTRDVAKLTKVFKAAADANDEDYDYVYELNDGQEADEEPVAGDDSDDGDTSINYTKAEITPEIKSVIRALRKVMRFCPKADHTLTYRGQRSPVFFREDLMSDWSHKSLWALGAAVAILASFGGLVSIGTGSVFKRLRLPKYATGAELHLIEWVVKHNDTNHKYSNANMKQMQDEVEDDATKENRRPQDLNPFI